MDTMRLLRSLDETFPLPKLEARRHRISLCRVTGWLELSILHEGQYQRMRLTEQEVRILDEKQACEKILSLLERKVTV